MRWFTVIWFTVLATNIYAQKQNNNWCFGIDCGISFNTAAPTAFFSAITTKENCASISHPRTGSLMFYTDGLTVWNKNHTQMPNGFAIGTDYNHDCVQGSVIIPFPNDSNKFYIFTMDNYLSARGYMRYSVVDMTLSGGLGDVLPWQKAVVLDSNFLEAMTAVNVCNSVWIASVKRATNEFCLYNINPAGVNHIPVVSQAGYSRKSNGVTTLKISRDKQKLAVTTLNGADTYSYIALHDIDFGTGKVSKGFIIDSTVMNNEFYGCEFSPDNKKLFTTLFSSRQVLQYDISVPVPAAINSSRRIVYTASAPIGTPQLAPDNNIYIPVFNGTALDKISDCNLMSPACTYTPAAVPLAPSTQSWITLPQAVKYLDNSFIVSESIRDTIVCNTSSVILRAEPGHGTYIWHDNTTSDNITVNAGGKYWVTTTDSCFQHTDTIQLVITPPVQVSLGNDTAICDGDIVTLKNKLPSAGSYLWNTGSTANTINISDTGSYAVIVSMNICTATDTIHIGSKPLPVVYIGNDTTICENHSIILRSNEQPTGTSYYWSTGSNADSILVNGKGRYTLTVNKDGCKSSDDFNLYHYPFPRIELGNDTDMCFPGYVSIPKETIKGFGYSFLWSNGATDSTMLVDKNGTYKVTLTNICGSVTDSVTIISRPCNIWLPTAFSPNDDKLNDILKLAGDVGNVSRFKIIIYNRWGQNVFASADAAQGWDGNFRGHSAESGTYYYMISLMYRSKEYIWRGDITLLR